MKLSGAYAAALIAVGALVAPAIAQTEAADTTIVVSAKYQRDWDRGSRLEAEGLAELAEAERDLVGHSADVVNAQNRRQTSGRQAENARRQFETLTRETPPSDPREALRWAKQVEDAASDWEKFSKRGDNSGETLEREARRLADAQKDVEKAQEKIERGRRLMSEAVRRSRAD